MKRAAGWLLGVASLSMLLWLFLFRSPNKGLGQGCGNWMTPAYSEYTSNSSDGTNVYTSVTVSGTTHGNCPFGCEINCYGVYHTPRTYNVVGSVGGWGSGSSVLWSQQLYYSNNQQVVAAPGTLVNFSSEGRVICSLVGAFWVTTLVQTQVPSYTRIQHNYPNNPLPSPCRISQFFDSVQTWAKTAHRAEDVVFDNGNGGGSNPASGTVVTAAEGGTVSNAISGKPPATWPSCQGKRAPADAVFIQGSDNYITRYVHITPCTSSIQGCNGVNITNGIPVSAGQPIGVIDGSGCQSTDSQGNQKHHVHIGRYDPNGNPVNFTLPCVNVTPQPPSYFSDGLADDDDAGVN